MFHLSFLAAFVVLMISIGVVVRTSGILFVVIVDDFQSTNTEAAWITALLNVCAFLFGKKM